MTRQELADRLFELTGKSVKATSYTKSRFEELIAEAEAPAPSEPQDMAALIAESGAEVHDHIDLTPPTDGTTCPLCGHTAADEEFVSPGDPGTPLGACKECPGCGELFNAFSMVAVPMPKAKKPRKVLNPQSTIDKKADYVKAKTGANLFYDRVERLWTILLDGDDDAVYMSSKQLSETSMEGLVKMWEDRERSPNLG